MSHFSTLPLLHCKGNKVFKIKKKKGRKTAVWSVYSKNTKLPKTVSALFCADLPSLNIKYDQLDVHWYKELPASTLLTSCSIAALCCLLTVCENQPPATPLGLKIPLYTNNREVYSLRTLPSVCVSWIAQLCMTEQHRKHLLMLECRSPDRAGTIVLGMPLLQSNPAWIGLNLLPPASGLKSVVWPVKEQESHYLSEELRTMMTTCYSSDVRHILPENHLQNFPTYGCKNFFLISFSTPKGGTQAGCESCCNAYLRNVYTTLRSMSTKAIT